MKVDSKNINKFVDSFIEQLNYKIFLLYGNEESSINVKFKKIVNNFKKNNFLIKDIKQEDIKQNKSLLSEEYFSISFFGDKTLITLRLFERENDFTEIIKNIIEENNFVTSNNYIIIACGNLEKTSSLLKLIEKNENTASIVCYEEADWNMPVFISLELKKHNFNFKNDIIEYLSENLGKNKLIIENEIFKIDCYKGNGNRQLIIDDVKKTTYDIAGFDITELINAFCSFDKHEFFRLLNKFYQEKNLLMILIRSIINYFLQLQEMKYYVEKQGYNIDSIIEQKKIFWKQKVPIKEHLTHWTLKNINIFLEKLIELEKIKFNQDSQSFVEDFLLKSMLIYR